MAPAIAILGFLIAMGAFMLNTAPEGTHNLGLLQTQMMVLHCGLAMAVAGSIIAAISKITVGMTNPDGDQSTVGYRSGQPPVLLIIGTAIVAAILIAIYLGKISYEQSPGLPDLTVGEKMLPDGRMENDSMMSSDAEMNSAR